MTPDPRLVELVDAVQRELPDWTPPALPATTALLDRLAVERLRGVLKLAPSWPVNLRDQTYDAIVGVIHAIENDGDREAALEAAREAAREAAWSVCEAAWSSEWAALAASHAAAGKAAWSADEAAYASSLAARSERLFLVELTEQDAGAAYSAAWQREADRIAAAIQEQS